MRTIFATLASRLENPALVTGLASRAGALIQKNIQKGPWAPNAPLTRAIKGSAGPLQDDGQLLASIASRVEGSKAIVGTNRVQARLLHEGGIVKPVSAKYLTIPASSKTRSLMRSYGATPRTCIAGMKSDGYSVWFSFRTGGGTILARKGARGRPFPLFILRRSVTIPARPFMRLPPESRQALAAYLGRSMTSGSL